MFLRYLGQRCLRNAGSILAHQSAHSVRPVAVSLHTCRCTHSRSPSKPPALNYGKSIRENKRFIRSIQLLNDTIDKGDLDSAWTAYVELRDLESLLGVQDVRNEVHRVIPRQKLELMFRAVVPAFEYRAANTMEAARTVYRCVKLLDYLIAVSKLFKRRRNSLVVLRLALGQCIRRSIEERFLDSPRSAEQIVRMWEEMSLSEPIATRLTYYSIHLLILGAWKANRHLLIPYLYSLACSMWDGSDKVGFQRVSATTLSFYTQECARDIDPEVIHGLLQDLSQRGIKLLPHHYSMLILYFGEIRNTREALRMFERAMDDPTAQKTEAIYYYIFRAMSTAFVPKIDHWQKRSQRQTNESLVKEPVRISLKQPELREESIEEGYMKYLEDLDNDSGLDEFGDLADTPESTWHINEPYITTSTDLHSGQTSGHIEAAKICTSIFQMMADKHINIGVRTYRELIICMLRFKMTDKARRLFEFAIENLDSTKVDAKFVELYFRLTTRSPHEMQLSLRHHLRTMPDLMLVFRQFPHQVLADQFGIFKGDLQAFLDREKRPALIPADAGSWQSTAMFEYLQTMRRVRRAADFLSCILTGNDSGGKFKGYSFPTLKEGGAGLALVEAQVRAFCQWAAGVDRRWLYNYRIIYHLLPVIGQISHVSDSEPQGVQFVRGLVDNCATVGELVSRLDDARIEGFNIGMINQFMRVKYLGLTFRQYVQHKVAQDDKTLQYGARKERAMWPSFMYIQSNGPMAQLHPLDTSHGAYSGAVQHSHATKSIDDAKQSWKQLLALMHDGGNARLAMDMNTVGILSLVAVQAQDWAFGQQIWDDAFALLDRAGQDGYILDQNSNEYTSLRSANLFKNYLHFLTAATLFGHSIRKPIKRTSPALAAPTRHLFDDSALARMFSAIARHNIPVSSGLLCQGIRCAFEVGRIEIADVLEQWQLQRERSGAANDGYLRKYFGTFALPEIPASRASILGLVQSSAQCPQLSRLVAEQMQA